MEKKMNVNAVGETPWDDALPEELRGTPGRGEPEDEYYEEEYESIDDIARGEGFWIDEDGHWVPLDDEDDW